ncbi:MAG TPA: YggT family protein [Terriglobales bacterium]|nr:YggT family protein [Terriglobales bacterium]
MFVLSNLLIALAQILDYVLWAYAWIVLARVVISWVNADYRNPIVRFVHAVTEPVLDPVRRRLPLFAGGVDLSPLVVWLLIMFLQRFIVRSLYDLARLFG